jgi:hypothetical protein
MAGEWDWYDNPDPKLLTDYVPSGYRVGARGARSIFTGDYLKSFYNRERMTWTSPKDAAPAGRILDWKSISYPNAIDQPIPVVYGAGRFVGQIMWVGAADVDTEYQLLGYYSSATFWYLYGPIEGNSDVDPDATAYERRWGPLSDANANYLTREEIDVFVFPEDTYYKRWAVNRTYSGEFAVAFCESFTGAPLYLIKLFAGDKVVYDAETDTTLTGFEFTYYDGTQTAADPTIAAAEDGVDTPFFNGVAYVVFTAFDPMKFNGEIPVISAHLSENPWDGTQTFPVEDTLLELAKGLKYTEAAIEFDGDFNKVHYGWSLLNDSDYRSVISQVCDFYNIILNDAGESVRFVRTAFGVGATTDADLTDPTMIVERQPGNLVQSYRIMPTDLPLSYEITYPDVDRKFTSSVVTAQRASGFYATTPSLQKWSGSAPFALTETQAQELAETNLYMAAARSETHLLTVGPAHLYLEVGDIILVVAGGVTRKCQIVQTTLNPDFTLDIEAVEFATVDE